MPVITHANAPPEYVLPSELKKPVPRRIRLRAGHSLFVIWTVRLLLLPFGAIGAYFIRYLIDNAQQGDIWFLIIVGFYVLAWNAIWGLFFYVLVIAAWLERRLCRWGTPVPGRILKKCEEKGSKGRRYYSLDYEFEHPGLGTRIHSASVDEDEWVEARIGQYGTVLCYPGRKLRPLLYEHSSYECIGRLTPPPIPPAQDSDESYAITPGLLRPIPRRIKRRQKIGCFTMASSGLFLLLSAACIYFALNLFICVAVLIFGTTYPGQVTGSRPVQGKHGVSHYLNYSYAAGGQVQQSERGLSDDFYIIFSKPVPRAMSGPVEVRAINVGGHYFDEAFLPGESHWPPVLVRLVSFAIFGLPNGLPMYYFWQHWRLKQLYRRGTPVIGWIEKKFQRREELEYQFDHPGLGIRTLQMRALHSTLDNARVGKPVTVLCYPNHKRPTVIYEYGDFECV